MRFPWRDYLEALLVAVVLATFARTFVVQAFKIPTPSMEENLLVGDHILVNKLVFGPASSGLRSVLPLRAVRRGDVVVFRFPNDPTRDFIKRCAAVGGDRIEIRDKRLWVNGSAVDERGYVHHTDERVYPPSVFLSDDYRYRDNFGPVTVPDGELFFLGDNRDESHDSRFWGTVPAEFVRGRAVLIYWSVAAESAVVDDVNRDSWDAADRPFERLASVPGRTRWSRTFRLVR